MPHKVFDLAALSAAADVGASVLIPGVEPGGSRAGQPMKPALLIKDAWAEIRSLDTGAIEHTPRVVVYLKLSQEIGLDPGLILPIAQLVEQTEVEATAATHSKARIWEQRGSELAGQVWAPAYVGIRVDIFGTLTIQVDVHLDYERLDVPWMDWFIMWDFLDNVVNNERDY